MNSNALRLILLAGLLSISACSQAPVSQCPKAPSMPPVGQDMLERMNYLITQPSANNTGSKESR